METIILNHNWMQHRDQYIIELPDLYSFWIEGSENITEERAKSQKTRMSSVKQFVL